MSPRPESNQDAGGHACGRPKNGNTLRFGQPSKAEPRGQEIYDADRSSEPNRANQLRQVDASRQLMLNLSSYILLHPVLLPHLIQHKTGVTCR